MPWSEVFKWIENGGTGMRRIPLMEWQDESDSIRPNPPGQCFAPPLLPLLAEQSSPDRLRSGDGDSSVDFQNTTDSAGWLRELPLPTGRWKAP